VTRFAIGERTFNPHSAAFGALVNLAPQWQLTSNLAYTERAPKDYELLANGPHVATAAWEVGDPNLKKEKSTGLDLGAQWKSGPNTARVNAYVTRFQNYIGLTASGRNLDEEGNVAEPGDRHAGRVRVRRRARALHRHRGQRQPAAAGGRRLRAAADADTLDLEWRGDIVRAKNLDTGEPLPRIAPLRLGATLAYGSGPWSARLGFDYNAAQHRIPAVGARETEAYTLWNAADHVSHEGAARQPHLVRAHGQHRQQAGVQPDVDPDDDGVSECAAAGADVEGRVARDVLTVVFLPPPGGGQGWGLAAL
jgi:iron complex outermembrane receptor protein